MNINKLILLLFSACLFLACSEDDPVVTPPDKGEANRFTFSISTDVMEDASGNLFRGGALTRAIEEIEDDHLDDLWVLLYDADKNFLEASYSTVMSREGDTNKWTVEIDLYTPFDTECYVYCLANTHDKYLFKENLWGTAPVATVADLEKLTTGSVSWLYTPEGASEARYSIPMRGVGRATDDTSTTDIDTEPGLIPLTTNINITLHYLMARLAFSVETEVADIDIKSVQVKNVPQKLGYFQPVDELTAVSYKYGYMDYPLVASTAGNDFSKSGTFVWYIPRHIYADHSKAYKIKSTYIEVMATSAKGDRSYQFYPHKATGTEPDITYDFNLDAGEAIAYEATITGTRLATLNAKKHWSVMDPTQTELPDAAIVLTSNANCIMVPSQKYDFPIPYAFDIAPQLDAYAKFLTDNSISETIGLGDSDAWTANILWMDSKELVTLNTEYSVGTGPTGKIYFTLLAKDVQGNAVVELKKGSTTVWSWHLWILNHDPGTIVYTPNNTDAPSEVPLGTSFTFLNYNLGATANALGNENSYGLHYQWGRKDPFPTTGNSGTAATGYYGSDGTSGYTCPVAFTPTNSNNRVRAIQNPGQFITYKTETALWNGSNGTNSWGNGSLTTKTVFDPCPVGYYVPTVYAYGAELNNVGNKHPANPFNTGFDWTTISGGYSGSTIGPGIFPAAGYHSTSGIYNGTRGYYWSSNTYTSSSHGYYLYSTTENVSSRDYNNKGMAMAVRCVALH